MRICVHSARPILWIYIMRPSIQFGGDKCCWAIIKFWIIWRAIGMIWLKISRLIFEMVFKWIAHISHQSDRCDTEHRIIDSCRRATGLLFPPPWPRAAVECRATQHHNADYWLTPIPLQILNFSRDMPTTICGIPGSPRMRNCCQMVTFVLILIWTSPHSYYYSSIRELHGSCH